MPASIPPRLVNMKDSFFSAEHDVPLVYRMGTGQRVAINVSKNPVTVEGTTVPAHAARRLSGPSPALR